VFGPDFPEFREAIDEGNDPPSFSRSANSESSGLSAANRGAWLVSLVSHPNQRTANGFEGGGRGLLGGSRGLRRRTNQCCFSWGILVSPLPSPSLLFILRSAFGTSLMQRELLSSRSGKFQ